MALAASLTTWLPAQLQPDQAVVVDATSGQLSVVSATGSVLSSVVVGPDAIDVVVSHDGTTAFVSLFGPSRIARVDLTTSPPSVIGSVSVPFFAEDIDLACGGGRYALVTDGGGSQLVVSVDIQTMTVADTLTMAGYPLGVAVAGDCSFAVVAHRNPHQARFLAISPNGLLTDLGGTATNGDRPNNVALSPDDRFAVVTHFGDGSVSTFDLRNGLPGTLVSQRAVYPPSQSAVFSPASNRLYVYHPFHGVVVDWSVGSTGVLPQYANAVYSAPTSASSAFGVDQLAVTPTGSYLFMRGSGFFRVLTLDSSGNGVSTSQDFPLPGGDLGGIATLCPATPSGLGFDVAPAPTVSAGQPWQTFRVRVEDDQGNRVAWSTEPITVSVASGTGTLSGTLTRNAVGGIATFDNLSYDVAETVGLSITSGALQSAQATVLVKPFVSDLRITASDLGFTPVTPAAGQSTQIAARVVNAGTDPGSALVRFYDGNPDFGGVPIGQVGGSIGVGGSKTFTLNGWIPATDGTKSIFAVVDNLSPPEATPADNRAVKQVTVGAAPIDLRVGAEEVVAWPGASTIVPVTITNRGFGPATIDAVNVGPPAWLTLDSTLLGTVLQPGQSVLAQTTLDVPSPLSGAPLVQSIPFAVDSAGSTFVSDLVVKVYAQPVTDVTVRVVDASTSAPIAGALVSAQDLPGTYTTDGAGQASLVLPPGGRGLFAYKSGYVANAVTADIPQGASTVEIPLTVGETLGVAQVVSEPLSTQEILNRGITVNDPVNNEVYDFVVGLEIGAPLSITNVELPRNPPAGTTVQFSSTAYRAPSGGSSTGGGGSIDWNVTASFTYNAEGGRTETWIFIPGSVWVLKQFFEVTTLVVNNTTASTPSDVQLRNTVAQLNVPAGLGLPDLEGNPQSPTQSLGTLDAGAQAQATWVIRGDVAGRYTLDGLVTADLVAFNGTPIPLSAVATSAPFDVTTPSISCQHITPGAVQQGQPFAFGVLVTNESTAPAQLVRVVLKEENLINCTLEGTQGTQAPEVSFELDPVTGAVVSATFTIGDLEPAHSGQADFVLISDLDGKVEQVEIMNGCGGNAAPTVEVVADPPTITGDPQGQFVCEGDPVTLTVTASGGQPLSYQWSKDGVPIGGATSASFTIAAVMLADGGSYDVAVSNPGGSVTSAAAVLTVGQDPTISTQPADQTVCQGDPVVLTVAATGLPAPAFQWRKDGNPIAGATAASLAIAAADVADAGSYDVVVSNTCGTVTSAAATLVVDVPPTVDSSPVDTTVTEGEALSLTVSASGTGPLSYQWRKNGLDLAGETAAGITIDPVSPADAGAYDVVVSNHCGSATSAAAAVTVNLLPVITCNGPIELWSPSHDLVDVSSAFSVQDPEGQTVAVSIRVFSDEPEVPDTGDGTGNHSPDFKNEIGGRGLLLRSERQGPSPADGRWYVAVITADDGNGGVVTHACALGVCPHDQNQASMDLVKAEAAAAAAAIQGAIDSGSSLPVSGQYEHGLAAPMGPKQ